MESAVSRKESTMTAKQFGKAVAEAREKAGLSRAKLAEKAGYSMGTILNVESGKLTQTTVAAIAGVLDIPKTTWEPLLKELPEGISADVRKAMAKGHKATAKKAKKAKESAPKNVLRERGGSGRGVDPVKALVGSLFIDGKITIDEAKALLDASKK